MANNSNVPVNDVSVVNEANTCDNQNCSAVDSSPNGNLESETCEAKSTIISNDVLVNQIEIVSDKDNAPESENESEKNINRIKENNKNTTVDVRHSWHADDMLIVDT